MDSAEITDMAQRLSFDAFMNSFLKEWNDHWVEDSGGESVLIIAINQVKFHVPILSRRKLGKFQTKSFVQKTDSHGLFKLTPLDAAGDIIHYLSLDKREEGERFYARVKASFHSMEEALRVRLQEPPEVSSPKSKSFIDFEQDLILGHPFHPTPKSREALSREEAQIFCPEYRNAFGLTWYLVDPEVLFFQHSESFAYERQEEEVFCNPQMLHNNFFYKKGYRLLPVHPWQEKALLNREYFQKYLKTERVVLFHKEEPNWRATSSLRTVFSESSPNMLKFSLSLKLTNSVRHLLPKEVDRGLQLYDVVKSAKFEEFKTDHNGFHILCEPFYLCLKDESGEPSSDSVVVFRENPFRSVQKSKDQAVLSSLTQENLQTAGNGILDLVAEFIGPIENTENLRGWFKAYCQNVLKPFIILQADYGVLLGAHQQNLVISLKNGIPQGCYFRDCQGTGYSELGFKLYSQSIASIREENENVVSSEMGHALFGYYLITNSSFGVISALSQLNPEVEEILIEDLRNFLIPLRAEGVKDPSFLDYLLKEERLKFKGNFFCTLRNINENTTLNPLEIYTLIQNPMKPLPKEKAL